MFHQQLGCLYTLLVACQVAGGEKKCRQKKAGEKTGFQFRWTDLFVFVFSVLYVCVSSQTVLSDKYLFTHTVLCCPASPGCWLRHSVWEAAGWGGSFPWQMLCGGEWIPTCQWHWGLLHFPTTSGQSVKREGQVSHTSLTSNSLLIWSLPYYGKYMFSDPVLLVSERKTVYTCISM